VLTLAVAAGEVHVLPGINGTGKPSLANMTQGLAPEQAVDVIVKGMLG